MGYKMEPIDFSQVKIKQYKLSEQQLQESDFIMLDNIIFKDRWDIHTYTSVSRKYKANKIIIGMNGNLIYN